MRLSLLCCLLAGSLFAQQQHLTETFSPLRSEGELPPAFTQDFRASVQAEVLALKKEDKKDEIGPLLSRYGKLETMVKSGNALINGEVTAYLNQVLGIILKDKPELKNNIRVYAFKSPTVNTCSIRGDVFVNIGLIAQAENEAQLAYLLAREAAHYTARHNLTERPQPSQLAQDASEYGKDLEDELIKTFGYTKEDEGAADLGGYGLYKQSAYSLKQPGKVFDLLQYAQLPFDLVEFKKSFLETDHYQLPDSYFLKEVAPIASRLNVDDMESMHPNINKRKMAVNNLAENDDNSGRKNYLVGESQFAYIRDLARFELCRLLLKRRDYPNALYAAYALSKKYPANEYLSEVVSKCLYGLALYRNGRLSYYSNSALPSGPGDYQKTESYPQQVYYLIDKMPPNEWAILALNYSYRAHLKFPANKAMALVSDSLFGLMAHIDWGVPDFIRSDAKQDAAAAEPNEPKSKTELIANIQKEKNKQFIDTMYFKDVYLDLFMNDKVFTKKFPLTSSPSSSYGSSGSVEFQSYGGTRERRTSVTEKKVVHVKADTLLLVAPFYYTVTIRNSAEVLERPLDPKDEDLAKNTKAVADKMMFKLLVPVDPGTMTPGYAEKLNDYSVLQDWLFESNDINGSLHNMVLSTDEAQRIASQYKTPYVLKVGFVSVPGRSSGVVCYTVIYDLVKNKVVFSRREKVTSMADKTVMTSKIYQVLNELKYHKLVED